MNGVFNSMATVLLFTVAAQAARAEGRMAGVTVADHAVVDGTTLPLIGAGIKKRGYYYTEVTSLYEQGPVTSYEEIENNPGPKRLNITLAKDLTGRQLEKFFLRDFHAVAKPEEFKKLIEEVGVVGKVYSRLGDMKKGDSVNIDWVPSKGLSSSLNGNALPFEWSNGTTSFFMKNELMYKLLLRTFLDAKGSGEFQENMLGKSRSMFRAIE